MAKTLVILDSVTAARAWLARATAEAEVLTTHYSVVDFLRVHDIAAQDCSDFVDERDARALLTASAEQLDTELARLDAGMGAAMCAAAGLPALPLFRPAYKYLGQYSRAGSACLAGWLRARFAHGNVVAVEYFHALGTSVDPLLPFVTIAGELCGEACVPFTATVVAAESAWIRRWRRLRAARWSAAGLRSGLRSLRARLARSRRVIRPLPGTRCVLLLDPEWDSFFAPALGANGANVVRLPRHGCLLLDAAEAAHAERTLESVCEAGRRWLAEAKPLPASTSARLAEDLLRRARELVLPLVAAEIALRGVEVHAVAWDASLATRPALNVLLELFLARRVPVFGRQHGACYGDQDLGSIHFDCDFDRCTHYFSYGFDSSNYRATYPLRQPRCEFLPAGHPRLRLSRRRRRVDVAFPLSSCNPLFYFARMPEAAVARRQARIIAALEARADLDSVIKLPPGCGPDNFGLTETVRALRHARTTHEYWSEFLAHHTPRLVVCELASTPLLQALELDVDIFLLLDPTFPFSAPARELLEKRAHLFESIEDLVSALDRYDPDGGPRRRDDGFYRTYANRGAATPAELLRAAVPANARSLESFS